MNYHQGKSEVRKNVVYFEKGAPFMLCKFQSCITPSNWNSSKDQSEDENNWPLNISYFSTLYRRNRIKIPFAKQNQGHKISSAAAIINHEIIVCFKPSFSLCTRSRPSIRAFSRETGAGQISQTPLLSS